MVSHVEKAMEYHFGPPDVAGWDKSHCKKMQQALHNHLLTGLSRDYNSPLGKSSQILYLFLWQISLPICLLTRLIYSNLSMTAQVWAICTVWYQRKSYHGQ